MNGSEKMKIIEVLERVDKLYPHKMSTKEMIDFCNELGANIAKNYVENFGVLFAKDGDLLPEGVRREDIIKVIKDGKELARDDYGLGAVYYPDSKKIYFDSSCGSGIFKVIYREPYYPIRYLKFKDTLKKVNNGFEFSKEHDIRVGDILVSGDKVFNVTEIIDGKTINGEGDFDGTETDGTETDDMETEVERMIDDLTVVDAPYDNLYIEYLLSKVQRFSGDYEAENRSLANYNQILEDFSRFLVENGKSFKATQFINYW